MNKDVRLQTQLDELGFGAGGLPPLMFSHAKRNWLTNTMKQTEYLSRRRKRGWMSGLLEDRGSGGKMGKDRVRDKVHYGPGDSLEAIATSQADSEEDSLVIGDGDAPIVAELGVEEEPGIAGAGPSESLLSKEEATPEKTPSKRRKITISKSRIQTHLGGRGLSRRKVHFNLQAKAGKIEHGI